MKKQHVLSVILTLVIMTIATTTLASITDVNAQSTSGDQGTIGDTEQVKEYLNQAMQALDDGNNTLALEQVDLASDAVATMTGVSDTGEEDDNSGTTEEGAGEDADEAGDDDTNDEEDSESK
jgi:hypothetical protein